MCGGEFSHKAQGIKDDQYSEEREGCFLGASLVCESYRAWSCFSLSGSERAPEQDAGGWSAERLEKHQNTKRDQRQPHHPVKGTRRE